MRKIIAGLFQSADGVIQSPGAAHEDASGGFTFGGWLVPHFDEKVGAFMGQMMGGPHELLLGRRTFDIMAGHWPKVSDDPFADHINATAKYVVTSRPDVSAWNNSHALAGIDAVAALKEEDGPDLITQGSHTLHGPLAERGLIDGIFLLTFPVILGRGKRLFDTGEGALGLKLVETSVSDSGVIMSVYESDGPVKAGALPAPAA